MDDQHLQTKREIQRTVLISLGVVAVGLALYFIFHRTDKTPSLTSNKKVGIAAITPETYTMISGKIMAIDNDAKTIAIDFPVVGERGQGGVKHYAVTIGDTTVIQSVNASVTPASATTINLNDLAIGDTVDALSDTNIAATETFTATSIIRSQP